MRPNPYPYLQQLGHRLPDVSDLDQLRRLLNEVELSYDAMVPEYQSLAADLIERLRYRIRVLERG